MDYFQGVVTEYLRANRSTFVNAECCIQLDPGEQPLKGRHWYCDAVAADFEKTTIFLCEVTYSQTLQTLVARLQGRKKDSRSLCEAIARDCHVPGDWSVQPWVFIPGEHLKTLEARLAPLNIVEAIS